MAVTTLSITGATDEVTCNVTATAAGTSATKAIKFTPDIWPQNSDVVIDSAGVAERQGVRSAPLIITVLRPEMPPAGMNEPVNWPPIANLRLKLKVGRVGANGSFVEDTDLGTVTPATGTTDANGQIKANFTAKPGKTQEGSQVFVAWLDRNGALPDGTVARFFVFTQSNTDQSSKSNPRYYTDCNIKYKTSITDQSISEKFKAALCDWDAVQDANGDHFKFAKVDDPSTSNPKGFEAISTCPDEPGQYRPGWADVGDDLAPADSYRKMNFYKDALKPDPAYTRPVNGNENICRSFAWTPPSDFLYLVAAHEIGHVLGINHHRKADGQNSLMAVGRDPSMIETGAFIYYVNFVTTPSAKDKEYVNTISYPNACP